MGQTDERYKGGLIAVTDVQIAKAELDSVTAEVLAAENALSNAKEQLKQIIGVRIETFNSLRNDFQLTSPAPNNVERWVCLALEQNYKLQAARFRVNEYRKDINLKQSDHYPTVNIDGNVQRFYNGIIKQHSGTDSNISLQINVPIFNGGKINSKTRQAMYLYGKTQSEMEMLYREIDSDTRQYYNNVLTQISKADAFKQAIGSNKNALKATDDSFLVGSRTIVDVLNAQNKLIQAEQSYTNARYDYILESVQLKKAAGTLCPEDVVQINRRLVATPP